MKQNKKYKEIIKATSYKPIGSVLLRLCGVGFSVWEYGTVQGRIARRHKIKKNVQFILWYAGTQGHEKYFWHNFHPSWYEQFEKQ